MFLVDMRCFHYREPISITSVLATSAGTILSVSVLRKSLAHDTMCVEVAIEAADSRHRSGTTSVKCDMIAGSSGCSRADPEDWSPML